MLSVPASTSSRLSAFDVGHHVFLHASYLRCYQYPFSFVFVLLVISIIFFFDTFLSMNISKD